MLRLAKAGWELISYADYKKPGRVCLWRHDLDLSVHRGYKLALIEKEEEVSSTFFIHLHSNFYNVLEEDVTKKIFDIASLGHSLGLHFDPHFYHVRTNNPAEIAPMLQYERDILQTIFHATISSFSLHTPSDEDLLSFCRDEIGGMVNANSASIRKNFSYCSDSNGYWRFRDLKSMLSDATDEKIQVLTHPEMWAPEAMSPRERVSRCIDGRAARQHQWYDDALEKYGRENVR